MTPIPVTRHTFRREQIFALKSLGVGLVVTLTEETPLPAAWFRGTGVENLFVPVPNYEPPSEEQMGRIMGRSLGQTGTVFLGWVND